MTVNVPMQTLYDQFEAYLKPGDRILDLGCGSGRDSKYFLSKGYDVVSIDGSIEMCRLATKYLGKEVQNVTFNDINYFDEFDAIWASASLLHIDTEELRFVLALIKRSLRKNGLLYASWKYGHGKRVDNMKIYIDFDETNIKKFFDEASLRIEKVWITNDNLTRENKWLNVLSRKI